MTDKHWQSARMLAELESLRRRAAELDATKIESRRLAAALRDTEERYRLLLDELPLVCISVDPGGAVTHANTAAWKLIGGEPSALTGTHIGELLTPVEPDLPIESDRLIVGELGPDTELGLRTADGGVARLTVCGSVVDRDPLGRHRATVLIMRGAPDSGANRPGSSIQMDGSPADIAAAPSVDESERRYRSLFEESIDVVYVTSTDGRLIDISPSSVGLFGYPREELLGRDVHGLYADPEQRLQFQEAIERDGFVRGFEIVLLNKEGRRVDCLLTSTIRKGPDGETVGYQGIIRDITTRKRIEAARERERRAFRVIAEAAAKSADITALCQRIIDGMVEVLGYDGGTLRLHDPKQGGLQPVSMAGVSDDERAILREEHSTAEDRECLVSYIARTGEPIFASDVRSHRIWESHAKRLTALGIRALTGCPVFGTNRNLLAVMLLFTRHEIDAHEEDDRLFFETVAGMLGAVLERKLSEEEKREVQAQLVQAQKMEAVGTLASGVAHDFNNLLTAIQGFAELALLSVDETDRIHEDLTKIRTAADRGAGLVRQLLMFGREQTIELRAVDINESVRSLLKMVSPLIGEDVNVRTVLDPDLRQATADEGSVQQVLMNLAVNARDAMPEGGTLTIRTRNVSFSEEAAADWDGARAGDFVCIAVEDSGAGMDQDTIERIFDPFFSTKGPGKGTGLGLAVVYGIVKQHGGWIYTVSTPRMGTTFEVYLPAGGQAPRAHTTQQLKPTVGEQGSGQRIMVVEDEDAVRDLAATILRKSGYVVFEAANVDEALDTFEREDGRLDLVFSDVVLPDRSGVQLADELLKIRPELPILMTSGHASSRSQWNTISSRGIPFIQKPYSLPGLLQKVEEIIGQDAGRNGNETGIARPLPPAQPHGPQEPGEPSESV